MPGERSIIHEADVVREVRDRLFALRADLRQRLAAADALDAGLLRVLADVEIVLAALDRDCPAGHD